MNDPSTEILSEHHKYWEGYIAYADIQLSGLPESVNVAGEKLLKKTEFHITVINANRIGDLINPSEVPEIRLEILAEFKEFIKSNKLDKFNLLNEFRLVQKDTRKTVIVLCVLPGAAEFFAALSEKYEKPIPVQPFHVTLYTLPSDKTGIGILSNEELAQISAPINLPELKNLKPA